VASSVVTGWPCALVVLPSHKTATSPAPSIAVLPAKPAARVFTAVQVPPAGRLAVKIEPSVFAGAAVAYPPRRVWLKPAPQLQRTARPPGGQASRRSRQGLSFRSPPQNHV